MIYVRFKVAVKKTHSEASSEVKLWKRDLAFYQAFGHHKAVSESLYPEDPRIIQCQFSNFDRHQFDIISISRLGKRADVPKYIPVELLNTLRKEGKITIMRGELRETEERYDITLEFDQEHSNLSQIILPEVFE